jgi:hypothetical protein
MSSNLEWLVADGALYAAHALLVLFNLFGWVFAATRRWHLASLGALLVSWFGLGSVYGWGYCPLTDWHFAVRAQLGQPVGHETYLQLAAAEWFGANLSRPASDALAIGGLAFGATGAALGVIWGYLKHRKLGNRDTP